MRKLPISILLMLSLMTYAYASPAGFTRSTDSVLEGKSYACRIQVVSAKPPPDDQQVVECEGQLATKLDLRVYCFVDLTAMKAQKDKDNPSVYYACPVRQPIPFLDGQGLDLVCKYGAVRASDWLAMGRRMSDLPDALCIAQKFSIPWEDRYPDE